MGRGTRHVTAEDVKENLSRMPVRTVTDDKHERDGAHRPAGHIPSTDRQMSKCPTCGTISLPNLETGYDGARCHRSQ